MKGFGSLGSLLVMDTPVVKHLTFTALNAIKKEKKKIHNKQYDMKSMIIAI